MTINLAEGETIEKIDFALVRGGVITGRVTDADGRPVIGEQVRLAPAGQSDARTGSLFNNPFMYLTDDRGIYRIYGLQPGRYLVSIGEDSKGGMVRMGAARAGVYTRTFHPNVTDETKATVIELMEGTEATGVDITLGRRTETYAVAGRVVDAETGKPINGISMGYGSLREGDKQMGGFGIGTRTDEDGRFHFEGLVPGRYAVFTVSREQSDSYSLPAPFEISDADVTNLTVKVRRGVTLSGVAVIEGTNDRAILAKVAGLRINHWPESESLVAPTFGEGTRINADSSFVITGLSPGKVRLMLSEWPPQKGFTLVRVEREGVEQRAGMIEIPSSGQVAGVRLVFEYGTGVIRGQVRVENGALPENAYLFVSARRPSQTEPTLPGAQVDARGRFLMEGLPSGEYELRLGGNLSGQRIAPLIQKVNVTNGTETQATFVIDPSAKGETEKR
jgi:protocatechuate 3,4-dioxygenase beta subunit